MRWRSHLGWMVGLAVVLGSCVEHERHEISDENIDRWIELVCESESTCECSDAREMDVCTQAEETAWEARRRAASARELVYDAECVIADIDALEAVMCEWPEPGTEHACHAYCAVFHGDREQGESCEAYDERTSDCSQGFLCAAGRCVDPCTVFTGLGAGEICRSPDGNLLDRCADGLVCSTQTQRCGLAAALGQSCSSTEDCESGLYCDWQTGVPMCAPGRGAGESCFDTFDACLADLYCRWDDYGGNAFCTPYAQENQSCGNGEQCDEGLQCDWMAYVCRAPGTVGQSCAVIGCDDGLICDFNSVCATPPGLGAPCPQNQCAEGSWCDSTTDPANPLCAPVVADGEPCTGHNRCESGYCPAGYCLPRPALGEDCTDLFLCEPGLSCDGAVCKPSKTKGPAVCVYDGW